MLLNLFVGKKVHMERQKIRPTFVKVERSPNDLSHEVVIAIKKNNLDILEKEVLERATPDNSKYQSWMTVLA
jgi:hypothetical protein